MIVLATVTAETLLADRLIAQWATRADRDHAGDRRNQRVRYHSLLARAGIRALLANHTAQYDWSLCADSRGKLSAVTMAGAAGPSVCVAHTRGMVACAVGDVRALGVDIERHCPRAFNAIAAWSFGPAECATVAAGGTEGFYRIWTLREAIGKATGAGLALATDRTDRVGGGPDEGAWHERFGGQVWLLSHIRIRPDISVALAALMKEGEIIEAAAVRRLDLSAMVCGDTDQTNI